MADSPASSHREALTTGQTLVDREMTSSFNGINVLKTTYEKSEMMSTSKFEVPEDIEELDEEEEPEPEPEQVQVQEQEPEEQEEETDKVKTVQFVPPQYISPSPTTSPTGPASMKVMEHHFLSFENSFYLSEFQTNICQSTTNT